MSEEVYEKKILDKITDKIIDGYAKLMDKIRPGWYRRNKARVDEWKLMAYAFNRSPPGLIGFFLVIIFLVIAIIGPSLLHSAMTCPFHHLIRKPTWLLQAQ